MVVFACFLPFSANFGQKQPKSTQNRLFLNLVGISGPENKIFSPPPPPPNSPQTPSRALGPPPSSLLGEPLLGFSIKSRPLPHPFWRFGPPSPTPSRKNKYPKRPPSQGIAPGAWPSGGAGEGFCGLEVRSQKSFRNPNPYWSWKKYCSTPPVCTAVRAPICIALPPRLLSLQEKETQQYTSHLYCSTPPICAAVRLPSVRQYF